MFSFTARHSQKVVPPNRAKRFVFRSMPIAANRFRDITPHPPIAPGIARDCFARCSAKRKLRWPGQIDVRFFERGSDEAAGPRRGEIGEQTDRGKCAGVMDRAPLW